MELFLLIWICSLTLWFTVYFGIKWKINQPMGPLVFGTALVLFRLGNWSYRVFFRTPAIKFPVIAKPIIEKISDYISVYQLKHTEVILGMAGNKPIRIDAMDGHTLLGASSGGSKTWLLHSILIQLFGKGSRFMDNVEVYVCDFKGHPDDMWDQWQPLLTGYAKKNEMGSITACIELLEKIDQMLQTKVSQRVLLIIEEAVVLTADKKGDELLGRIASQLRLNGSLIVTIQHPQYTKMQTFIKHNIMRRIAGMVINLSQAEVILEVKPKEYELPEGQGEYLIRQSGKRHLVKFTAMKPDLPTEIKTVVENGISILAENDDRLRIFKEVCLGKKKGAAITGAETLGREMKWLRNGQHRVMVAYRNFGDIDGGAGVFISPKKLGQRNHLAVDFEEGFAIVRQYIDNGKWKEEAQPIVKK